MLLEPGAAGQRGSVRTAARGAAPDTLPVALPLALPVAAPAPLSAPPRSPAARPPGPVRESGAARALTALPAHVAVGRQVGQVALAGAGRRGQLLQRPSPRAARRGQPAVAAAVQRVVSVVDVVVRLRVAGRVFVERLQNGAEVGHGEWW